MTNSYFKSLIFLIILILPQEKLQYNNGKPTSIGIDRYVKENQNQFIKEFKLLVKDSIYNDMYFDSKNFKKTTDSKQYDPYVLAYNEQSSNYGCEIVINNEEKFTGYEYKNNKNKKYYNQNDYFVKSTIFHEIMHYYFSQCMLELKYVDSIEVNQYYNNTIFIYPNIEMQFGAKFIEEGLCEYLIQHYQEVPELKEYYQPKTIGDLKTKSNRNNILYGYASQYIKDFCDIQILKFGSIKYPIFILLKNRPPNYQEILNPYLFYKRLVF